MTSINKISIGSFFAGIGGIDLGFELTNHFNTVYANEIDLSPIKTYEENFNIKVDGRDICQVHADEIPNFDVMVGGFPCQAFSVAGLRKGFDDEKGRGTLFFEMVRIIKEKRQLGEQPQVVFFENVKNLVGHDGGNTFAVILNELSDLGYNVKWKVMNSSAYGNSPQNRERIYIVGFLDNVMCEKFNFPSSIQLTTKLCDVIDFDVIQEPRYYYTADNCRFFDTLEKSITDSNTVYQWRRVYVRANKSGLCPTLTANMGTGGHNVPLVRTKYGIRKLTPRECFSIQGFPETFKLPSFISNSALYKQAGNSVAVGVISRIAEEMWRAICN